MLKVIKLRLLLSLTMKENSVRIIYIIGISVSFVLMLILLMLGDLTLNLSSIIFFYAVKFLSGFGLILSIANGFLIFLDIVLEKRIVFIKIL